MKIGILIESLDLPYSEALETCARLGVDGVQFYGGMGVLDAAVMTTQKRAELRRKIEKLGLVVSAVCGELGGFGLEHEEENEAKIQKLVDVARYALEMGTGIVSAHFGVIDPSNAKRADIMRRACDRIGREFEKIGARFAVETGPETCLVLKSFLDSLDTGAVGVNFDPANLLMVTGDDPVQGVITLKDYIWHVHAKDGIRFKNCDPVALYDAFARNDYTGFKVEDFFAEKAFGEGALDVKGFINALDAIGYDGFVTVEREEGNQRVEDVEKAVKLLRASPLLP
jgi:L-ribulose-5-phosphate 3-epimerase